MGVLTPLTGGSVCHDNFKARHGFWHCLRLRRAFAALYSIRCRLRVSVKFQLRKREAMAILTPEERDALAFEKVEAEKGNAEMFKEPSTKSCPSVLCPSSLFPSLQSFSR